MAPVDPGDASCLRQPGHARTSSALALPGSRSATMASTGGAGIEKATQGVAFGFAQQMRGNQAQCSPM